MSSPFIAPNDSFLAPIPEEGRQSPVLSLAPSTATLDSLTKREQYKPGHIPTVTFVLDYPPSRQHLVLPLPETYEGAIQAISDFYNGHQSFLSGPASLHPDPNEIVLEIRSGTTYAVIEPSLWSQLVQPGALVRVWSTNHDGNDFMHGPVYLCFGKRAEDALKTVWTVPDLDDLIDCPFSYKHTIELVKRRIDKGGNKFQEWTNKDLTHASFTFYTLTSFKQEFLVDTQMDTPKKKPSGVVATMKRWFKPRAMEGLDERVWRKLHPDIYDDEEAWRHWVPFPGACLGVIVQEMEKEHKH